ncbi:hypothetical protein HOP62_07545 [Halomonas sp. MCCC 1A17488]|uniref:hypothetical protein n=1 Tax=unclassified Halomonas TaxID=2609666 RepID=UPI0018D21EC3|nr:MULTISPECIES: hypothetical protein [unclassified Halomonas]MCE8015927.1 hypothetical protein [Halomonas sp. MCCC 1A17488]MCG3239260.1 hypothetical protein [Halomonas sp. MCCC 1A17488]QPP50806.1 hypothetical protein I4484_06840 [Halomonas sp. SS10-MC5]
MGVKSVSVYDYWCSLDGFESKAGEVIEAQLEGWESVYKELFEAGLFAINLANSQHVPEKNRLPLAFMKTALVQFRSVWNLVGKGYSSSAACVAASIFETCKVVRVVSSNQEDLELLFSREAMDVPWTAKTLCQKVARLDATGDDGVLDERFFEECWQVSYLNYKWLCQIKHPTSQYMIHDLSSAMSEEGYHLSPVPNVSASDVGEKFKVLAAVASDVWSMCKTVCEEYKVFDSGDELAGNIDERLLRTHGAIVDLMKKLNAKGGRSAVRVFKRDFLTTDFSMMKKRFGD